MIIFRWFPDIYIYIYIYILCDGMITRPEESYWLWSVVVCDPETSRMWRPWPALGRSATGKKKKKYIYIYVWQNGYLSFLQWVRPHFFMIMRRLYQFLIPYIRNYLYMQIGKGWNEFVTCYVNGWIFLYVSLLLCPLTSLFVCSTGELSTCWYILLSGSVFIDGSMFLPRSR